MDENRDNFQFQKDRTERTFFPDAVSFIDAFQMATDEGSCAINNKKKSSQSELI